MDAELQIPHPTTVYANSSGEFPPIYFDMSKKITAVVRRGDGTGITHIEDARYIAGPNCPHCGKPLGLAHSASEKP
jgi:hypothetical protein